MFGGGFWIKKKNKIIQDEQITPWIFENRYPDTGAAHTLIDTRTTQFTNGWPLAIQPNKAPVPNTTDYFFLPAFGNYYSRSNNNKGSLESMIGRYAAYWSSNASPMSIIGDETAMIFIAEDMHVYVTHLQKSHAYPVSTFE